MGDGTARAPSGDVMGLAADGGIRRQPKRRTRPEAEQDTGRSPAAPGGNPKDGGRTALTRRQGTWRERPEHRRKPVRVSKTLIEFFRESEVFPMRVKNRVPIRRALAATLALLMMLSMTVTAFAIEPDDPDDGFYPGDDPGVVFDGDDGSSGEYAESIETGLADVPVQTEDGTEAIPIETETTPATDDELLPAVTGFSDVPSTHGFYTAIMDCAAKGITSGYADGTFRPTNSVTKAQFSVMLSRAFYPDKVKALSTEENKAVAWYYPNVLALKNAGVLKDVAFANFLTNKTIMDQAIPRYQMAQLMTNIMSAKGFSATAAQKAEAQKKITDYKTMHTKYQDAVKNVFALGIITGYSNGTFGGNNIMNRGQGCVVIYRMTKYTPAATTTPDTDDSGKPTGGAGNTGSTGNTGNTGNTGTGMGTQTPTQPETPAAKTLSNGKPVTEANVLALIREIRSKYPPGTNFGTGYTTLNTTGDVYKAIGRRTSVRNGCGAWAALVSDYIFGQTGAPMRKIDFKSARPGDILVTLEPNGDVYHVLAIISNAHHDDDIEGWGVKTTDAGRPPNASISAYTIGWDDDTGGYGGIVYDDGYGASTKEVWTRYPS